MAHRPLSQQLSYDDEDSINEERSDHALLRSVPTTTKSRSRSHGGGVACRYKVQGSEDATRRPAGESVISHSPYLLSYSPSRKGVPASGSSFTTTTTAMWGGGKLRSASSASRVSNASVSKEQKVQKYGGTTSPDKGRHSGPL